MANTIKPYQEEGSKKHQISKMFDNIAPYYDFLNHFLSLGIDIWWRKKAIQELKDLKPQIVLDIATGTGDLAIELAKQLKPKKIIGADIANEMLEIGKKKIKKRQLDKVIEMQYGDSENLSFENNSFDAITVAFGVRNYENLEKGLKEMLRVMKVGGRVVILEFSMPTVFPFKQLYHFYFRNILPLIGRITSKDPKAYNYLYESVQAFPDRQNFIKVLETVGYKNARYKSLTLGICAIYVAEK